MIALRNPKSNVNIFELLLLVWFFEIVIRFFWKAKYGVNLKNGVQFQMLTAGFFLSEEFQFAKVFQITHSNLRLENERFSLEICLKAEKVNFYHSNSIEAEEQSIICSIGP